MADDSHNESTFSIAAFGGFEEASRAVLEYLQNRFGFGLWMTTRTTQPHWIVLEAADRNYGVGRGSVFRWADSFCSKMVEGRGPQVVLDASRVQVYVESEIANQVQIGAYVGVPIRSPDGGLYGTLCAIDPEPQKMDVESELLQINLMGRLLGALLHQELSAAERAREIERLGRDVNYDNLSGLLNRKGWDDALSRERSRSERYGSPIVLFILDIDGLKKVNDSEGHAKGDELIRLTAEALNTSVRSSDVVARLGGDEFGVLAVECTIEVGEILQDKIMGALDERGINASIGMAAHPHGEDMQDTQATADKAMYEAKARKKRIA